MNKTVLVIAAHADDEVLGCGGTIARHVAEGDTVNLVLMADGVSSRQNSSESDLRRRLAATTSAQHALGISSVDHLELPDNRMDCIPLLDIVQRLEPIVRSIRPSIVFTHHHGDLNVDHRRTHEAVMTVCRPVPESSIREIYGFEVLSSTEWATPRLNAFLPTLFVDISKHLPDKLKALEAYSDEMREMPHSRSMRHVEALARHRGFSVGMDAAEAFEVFRISR